MKYEIGAAIRKKIEEKGISFVSFAEKFGVSDRNLQYFFKRSDISLQQATRASQILDYDFVKEYLDAIKKQGKGDWIAEEEEVEYTKKVQGVTTSLSVVAEPDNYYKNFPDFLKSVVSEAKRFGFKLI